MAEMGRPGIWLVDFSFRGPRPDVTYVAFGYLKKLVETSVTK